MPKLRLALAQTNPTVGAFEKNSARIVELTREARDAGADLVGFGEMSLSGYPIEDLAGRPSFLTASRAALERLAVTLAEAGLGDLPVLVGYPDGPFEPRLEGVANAPTAIAQNCAGVLFGGEVAARYAKFHLPNYSVFDEYRNFIPGDELLVLRLGDVDVAVAVCEDIWRDGGPVSRVSSADAGVLFVLNASPYERDKDDLRLPLVRRRAVETDAVVAYVNIVGGQDDLVFDGDSLVVDTHGDVVARAPQFLEHLLVVDVDAEAATPPEFIEGVNRVELPRREAAREAIDSDVAELPDDREQVWNAIVTGLRDYVEKNGFPGVLVALSGGIDSSIVAALAADAVGPGRVYGVSMPSRYSSEHSRSDADDLAERIGLHYRVQPIADLVEPFETALGLTGLAAENLQARVRAVVLMGISNMEGQLVLTTGNKSELAVGYSTIYGDSVGGFNPLKDVPKTLVWELSRWRNEAAAARGEVPPIPENSISKAPSAELRPGQKDEDSLPSYDVLDGILEGFVNQRFGPDEIGELGYDTTLVNEVIAMVDRSEWKRRQSAIGPKVSQTAFGRDRRLPITYRPGN